jgi:transposase
MIHLTANTQILLATEPADFRCGIDGLAAICRARLDLQPDCGRIFVFINRNKTMIRALSYDGSVFWLMTKRLSRGKFNGWPQSTVPISSVEAAQLKTLLTGANTFFYPKEN